MDLTTPFPESHERRVELLLLAVVSIWALNAPFVKYGLGGLDIWVFNGIRFTVASLLLLGIFLWRNTWVPVIRSDWPKLIGLGLLGNFFLSAVLHLRPEHNHGRQFRSAARHISSLDCPLECMDS